MIFKNIDVVTKDQVLIQQTVQIEEGKFISIKPSNGEVSGPDYGGYLLVPGFIDLHQHGTSGYDMMDATPNAVEGISKHLLKEGTTRFLATTMTLSKAAIIEALKAYSHSNPKGAKPLGIHLEGPFISKAFPGAQNPPFIMRGSIDLFDAFQKAANGAIKLVTLAPEEQDEAFLKYLIHQGIVLSMGHSAATESEVENALKLGIKRVTHCFNAMSQFNARDLGLVGMTLLHDEIEAELIPDGIHTSDAAIRLLVKIKKDKVSIVTDGIRAKGLKEGAFDFGGQTIHVKAGAARLERGALAGSMLTMDQALRKMLQLGIDLPEVVRMLSYNPAITMNQHHHLGQIKENYLADCVVLDQNHHVMETYVEGQLLFKNEQD
jgi:N-acetylglucosamine-6-phosphate deacetylase